MNPEHEHAEQGERYAGRGEDHQRLASARQEQFERLLARIIVSKRAADWRDLKERDSEEPDSEDPASELWDVMPRVAREFQSSGSPETRWEDLSVR